MLCSCFTPLDVLGVTKSSDEQMTGSPSEMLAPGSWRFNAQRGRKRPAVALPNVNPDVLWLMRD